MCGIFGLFASENCHLPKQKLVTVYKKLSVLSESRGKESSGFCIYDRKQLSVFKQALPASEFVETSEFKNLTSNIDSDSFISIVGHSRLVTNGIGALNRNNQPVIIDQDVVVHNGIIVNDEEIFEDLDQKPSTQVDTEAFLKLFQSYVGGSGDRRKALVSSFAKIQGNASICLLNSQSSVVQIATNNGSIYYCCNAKTGLVIFASEKFILQQILKQYSELQLAEPSHLKANHGLEVNLFNLHFDTFAFEGGEQAPVKKHKNSEFEFSIRDYSHPDYPDFYKIPRCTKCLLPHSFPGLSFDENGVCSKCNSHQPFKLKQYDELMRELEKYRSKNGEPDCLVGLSGGRDSCYGLHVIKNELGLNPIAYTYDWGLVTDLARRNISRMCGKLGVEHILVSADIPKKRRNVRKNINAWLKNPDVAMMPLFMAGDKQFYYYAHQLRKQTGIDLFMFAAGNSLERTDFKIGFSGLKGNSGEGILTDISALNKFKLAMNYGMKFLSNPRYLNSSIFDTLHAFYSSYLLKDDYFYLYYYHQWDEQTVNSTLFDVYDWEACDDTPTTWRIGDGTAAFYNYVYYVVCGFTEHDTFRSNQIREGVMSREQAMDLVYQENKPRWESLEWYASTIGFNLDEALAQIHRMKKMY